MAKQILNVTSQTLRNWDKNKLIRTIRTPTGVRMFNKHDIEMIITNKKLSEKITACYCRCIHKEDENHLQNQIQTITNYYPDVMVFSDICISSEWNRPDFKKLITLVANNKVSKLIITNENVISRVSYPLVKLFCDLHETEIIIIDEHNEYWVENTVKEFIKVVKTFCKDDSEFLYISVRNTQINS